MSEKPGGGATSDAYAGHVARRRERDVVLGIVAAARPVGGRPDDDGAEHAVDVAEDTRVERRRRPLVPLRALDRLRRAAPA